MMNKAIFALAMATLAIGGYSAKTTQSHKNNATLVAKGGSNCPVYYGCPAPPPPAPKGGGGNGGGGVDNPQKNG